MKIAVVSGRPKNGTLLPREEKLLWEEVKRVMSEDLKHFKNATLLIPIYSKFDLQALSIAEREGIKVCYYLPNEKWGTSKLPAFQLSLIERMRSEQKIVRGGLLDRIKVMIHDADFVYSLEDSDGFELFKPWLKNKQTISFSEDKLLYKSEKEAELYHKKLNDNRTVFITPADKMKLETIEEENQYQKDFPELDNELDLNEDIPWYYDIPEEDAPLNVPIEEIVPSYNKDVAKDNSSSSEPKASGIDEDELKDWLNKLDS